MSDSRADGGAPAGSPLQGPVNSVMGAIFDSVESPADDAAAEEGEGAGEEAEPESGEAAEAGAEPEVPGAPGDEGEGDEGDGGPAATVAPVRSDPPALTADSRQISEQFGVMAESLEERFTQSFEAQAIEQAEEDYPDYINALQLHPLELVGKELPSIDGSEDNVVFRSAAEVEQWQGAVKSILQRELTASVEQRRQDSNEVLDVVHASIQLFQDNPDLVPGSKSYNRQLAAEFVKIAEPYALKLNGKLTGYSIPVQGLVDQVRARVTAGAPPAAKKAPGRPAKKAAGGKPQAGIPSRAGASGGNDEDFSPMWKALGVDSAPI